MGAYSDRVIADGASHYWRLGEPSGTVAADSIAGGANAPGTVSGGVTLGVAGALVDGDTAMTFNGSTGKIQSTSIALPVICTLELWAKWLGGGSTEGMLLSTRGVGTGDAFVWYAQSTPQTLAFFGAGFVTGAIAVKDGAWHHLVCVLTGSTCTCYVDGVADTPGANTRSTPNSGALVIAADGSNPAWWNGVIDEVAVYPTALSAPTIAAHYALRTATGGGGGRPISLGMWRQVLP